MIDVKGFCPMGCGPTLFVAEGGYITCSFNKCPNPSYVSELLEDRETEHIVKFVEGGFTVQHPLREKKDTLMTCDVHLRLADLDYPPVKPGTYRFILTPDQEKPWKVQEVK